MRGCFLWRSACRARHRERRRQGSIQAIGFDANGKLDADGPQILGMIYSIHRPPARSYAPLGNT